MDSRLLLCPLLYNDMQLLLVYVLRMYAGHDTYIDKYFAKPGALVPGPTLHCACDSQLWPIKHTCLQLVMTLQQHHGNSHDLWQLWPINSSRTCKMHRASHAIAAALSTAYHHGPERMKRYQTLCCAAA